ncbi:unnamed protein product [Auanema sp. JU1783]|nr:unnamed protein product [Auanema sp. JU1783]
MLCCILSIQVTCETHPTVINFPTLRVVESPQSAVRIRKYSLLRSRLIALLVSVICCRIDLPNKNLIRNLLG